LLEYINHLTRLRKTLKLTTIREDVEPEESANNNKIDTYWACLVENQDIIDHVLETFINALDCYLIVDNEETKKRVVKRIQKIMDDIIDETILDQIITIQNAKGLESKNVVIYNLISDNLDIFKNLSSQNNKVSSMTFNKFYVATTRAEDSIIICEEKLNQANEVKSQLFYSNNRLMVENITVDDIQDYLLSSNDPERFLDQAEILIENQEYDKALKKSLIAIKNIVNQFRDHELFGNLISIIEQNRELSDIFISYNPRAINEIEKFKKLYDSVIDYCETTQAIDEIDLIRKRREILDESIRIRDISIKVQEYVILKNDLMDMDIANEFIEKFIILKEYHYAIKVSQNIENSSIRLSINKIIRYCFGYITYLEAADEFSKIEFSNYDFYKWLLDHKISEDTKLVLENIKNNLMELTNG
jgi:superfamily I DNA/RNA helicase